MSPHPVVRSVLGRLNTPGPLLAIGLGSATVAGSLWIASANRALSPEATKALYSFYFMVATIGTGVLAGLEQEMTRTVARAYAAGRPVGVAVRGQLRQAAGLAVVTVAALGAASPWLVSLWLHGSWSLVLALVVGLIGTWAAFLVRGLLAGCQDFLFYSGTLVIQGLATLVPSLLLAGLSSGHQLAYAYVFALAPLFAALSGLFSPAARRSWRATGAPAVAEAEPEGEAEVTDAVAGSELELLAAAGSETAAAPAPGPDEPEPGGSPREKLVLLTLATLVSQLLINLVPLVVGRRLDAGHAQSLNSSMGMSRLALLCLFPLQAPLLPLLAAAAYRRDFREVRRKTGFLIAACLGTGAVGVAVVAAAGPWLLKTYFATTVPLSREFLAALAASTAFLMTSFVLQAAQIALNRHRVVFGSWAAGLAAMAVVFVLPVGPFEAAAWAGILGPLTVTVIAALDVMFATREPAVPAPAAPAGPAIPVQAEPVAEGVRR